MTTIEAFPPVSRVTAPASRARDRADDHAKSGRTSRRATATRSRPTPTRPAGAPLRYRGSGATTSRAPHHRRAASPVAWATTFGLALLAAVITGWLGLVAQFGDAAAGQTAAVPDQLGVVRVQDGESLAQLAARVAPGAPSGQVVVRIRELNQLDSAALDAGQTLITPIG